MITNYNNDHQQLVEMNDNSNDTDTCITTKDEQQTNSNINTTIQNNEIHVLSPEDQKDAFLAHQYRLSLPSSPTQSNFRVLALLFYKETHLDKEEEEEDDTSLSASGTTTTSTTSHLPPWVKQVVNNRTFIIGTNDEPGYMGGSICAERAAMVQLRFVPSFQLTKLVIATDCEDVPISPGMLCREFLAGHGGGHGGGRQGFVPWDLKVISTGSRCARCQKKDEDIFKPLQSLRRRGGRGRGRPTKEEDEDDMKLKSYCCIDGHEDHALPTLRTTIAELYPFPSPYTRLTAPQSVALGRKYMESTIQSTTIQDLNSLHDGDTTTAKKLLELAILEAKQSVSSSGQENHPIHFGAAVLFEDQSISTSRQSSALEYGCTLDAVSQLVPYIQDKKKTTSSCTTATTTTTTTTTPVLIVQADQYGIAHSPFAPARAFLSENGYGQCHVLLHETPMIDDDNDVTCVDQWDLRKVRIAELAPSPPSWIATTTTGSEEAEGQDDRGGRITQIVC